MPNIDQAKAKEYVDDLVRKLFKDYKGDRNSDDHRETVENYTKYFMKMFK